MAGFWRPLRQYFLPMSGKPGRNDLSSSGMRCKAQKAAKKQRFSMSPGYNIQSNPMRNFADDYLPNKPIPGEEYGDLRGTIEGETITANLLAGCR